MEVAKSSGADFSTSLAVPLQDGAGAFRGPAVYRLKRRDEALPPAPERHGAEPFEEWRLILHRKAPPLQSP